MSKAASAGTSHRHRGRVKEGKAAEKTPLTSSQEVQPSSRSYETTQVGRQLDKMEIPAEGVPVPSRAYAKQSTSHHVHLITLQLMKEKWLGHNIVHSLLAVCAVYYSWTVPVYITFTPHRCGECNVIERFAGNVCFDLFAWLLLWFWFRYIRAGMEKAGAQINQSFLRYHSVFILSLIGLLPIDYFGYLASPSTAYYLRTIRLLFNAHPLYFRELYVNAMVLSSRMNVVFNLAYVMGMFFWLNHFVACIWWGVSRLEDFPSDDGEYWGPDEDLQNSRLRTQYLSALVWAVKATTSATTSREFDDLQRLVTITVVVAGIIVVSIIIAEICSIFMGANAVIAEYRQTMDMAEASLSHSQCPEKLRKKIHEYYQLAWQTKLAISSGGEFDALPPFVQKELNCAQKAELMSQVPLFRKDNNVMNSVAEKLGSFIAIKGDFIYREGELGHNMFFISVGSVQIMSEDPHNVYATLHDGMHFGESAMLGPQKRLTSVQAVEDCALMTLSYEDFVPIKLMYPFLLNDMESAFAKLKDLVNHPKQDNGKSRPPSSLPRRTMPEKSEEMVEMSSVSD